MQTSHMRYYVYKP